MNIKVITNPKSRKISKWEVSCVWVAAGLLLDIEMKKRNLDPAKTDTTNVVCTACDNFMNSGCTCQLIKCKYHECHGCYGDIFRNDLPDYFKGYVPLFRFLKHRIKGKFERIRDKLFPLKIGYAYTLCGGIVILRGHGGWEKLEEKALKQREWLHCIKILSSKCHEISLRIERKYWRVRYWIYLKIKGENK